MTSPTPVICPSCQHEQLDQGAGFCAKCRFPLMLIAGKYRLVDKLGEGGFGYVYLAEHVRLLQESERVVKIIKPQVFLLDPTMRVRFEREVQMTSILSQKCQHIVRIYDDFGEVPELGHFYVMEYLQGLPISAFIHDVDELPPLAWCIHVFGQLCDAMRRAHEVDIVHRDLKPDNLMLIEYGDEPHFLKVLDFGIAKPTDEINPENPGSQPMNITQGLLGTPSYMAPELFGEQTDVDFRVDIYAMGVILYEMLAGRTPFISSGRGPQGFFRLLSSHLSEPPPSFQSVCPERRIPHALEAAVMCALAKEPHDRFHSAMAFKEAVFDAMGYGLDGSSISLPPMSLPSPRAPSSRSGGVMVSAPRPTPNFTPAGASGPFERSATPLPSLPLQQEEGTAVLQPNHHLSNSQYKAPPPIATAAGNTEATALLKLPDNHPLRQESTPSAIPLAPMTPTPQDDGPRPTMGLPGQSASHTPFPSLQPPSVNAQHTPSSLPPRGTPPPMSSPASQAMGPSNGSRTPSSADKDGDSNKQRNLLLGLGGLIGGLALATFVVIFFQNDTDTKPPVPQVRQERKAPTQPLPSLPSPNDPRAPMAAGTDRTTPPALPTQPQPTQPQPIQPAQPQPARPVQPQPVQPTQPLPIRPLPIRPLPARRPAVTYRPPRRRRRIRRYRRRRVSRPASCPLKKQGIRWHPLRVTPRRARVRLQTNGNKEIMRLRGAGRYCVWFQSHVATLVISRPGYKDCSIKLRRLPRRLNLRLRRPGSDTDRRDYCSF